MISTLQCLARKKEKEIQTSKIKDVHDLSKQVKVDSQPLTVNNFQEPVIQYLEKFLPQRRKKIV